MAIPVAAAVLAVNRAVDDFFLALIITPVLPLVVVTGFWWERQHPRSV